MSLFSAARTRRLANTISMVLASHTVQVTTEAKARPINTAFTTGSALRYMPHGLRSRGSAAVATTLSCASAGTGAASHASIAALRNEAALNLHWSARASSISRMIFPKVPFRPTFSHTPSQVARCYNVTYQVLVRLVKRRREAKHIYYSLSHSRSTFGGKRHGAAAERR